MFKLILNCKIPALSQKIAQVLNKEFRYHFDSTTDGVRVDIPDHRPHDVSEIENFAKGYYQSSIDYANEFSTMCWW